MKTAIFLSMLLLAPTGTPSRSILGPPSEALPTTIALAVKSAAGEVKSGVSSGQEAPKSRPLAVAKVGEKPQVRWMVKNPDRGSTVRNVVLHFLVTRQSREKSPIPESPQQGSVVDQVFGTDLPPGKSVTGDYNTPIEEAGVYLVQMELLDEAGNRRQYCAVDLKVQ